MILDWERLKLICEKTLLVLHKNSSLILNIFGQLFDFESEAYKEKMFTWYCSFHCFPFFSLFFSFFHTYSCHFPDCAKRPSPAQQSPPGMIDRSTCCAIRRRAPPCGRSFLQRALFSSKRAPPSTPAQLPAPARRDFADRNCTGSSTRDR